MKLFSWMHKKINGNQGNSNTNIPTSNKNQTPQLVAQKEEFSDWPQGILSIGTLFNKKDDTKDHHENSPLSSSQNPIIDFTMEEVKELQKELSALISSKDLDLSTLDAEKLDKITRSSQSNYVDGDDDDNNNNNDEESDHIDQHFNNGSNNNNNQNVVANNKAKDVCMSRKKSMSFLLKKMFVCGVGGLGPSPSLRDPTLSARKTSISKILRAMLRKKIYPQSSCPTTSRKKYLGNGPIRNNNYEDENEDEEDELDAKGNNISKWDKSDTEFIVLEI